MIENNLITPLPILTYITPPANIHWIGRINWVDSAKAFGLILVFWGHLLYEGSPVATIFNRSIYSFHMPMYFILSGYVLKPDLLPFHVYIRNKFKRILLPAILLYILTLPIFFVSIDYSTMTLFSIICRILYLKGLCAYNSPIWFFFCLFQLLIVVKLLNLSNASKKKIMVVMGLSLILSFFGYESDSKYFNILGFNKCLLGIFFYTFGMILRRIRYEDFKSAIGYIALIVWLLSGVVFNTKCSMYAMQLGNFWLFILSGIAGSLAFFAFCKLFEKNRIIRKYANWTIFIVCSHFVLVSFFCCIASLLSIKGTYIFDITSVIFVFMALFAYNYVCLFIEKKVPVLIGK